MYPLCGKSSRDCLVSATQQWWIIHAPIFFICPFLLFIYSVGRWGGGRFYFYSRLTEMSNFSFSPKNSKRSIILLMKYGVRRIFCLNTSVAIEAKSNGSLLRNSHRIFIPHPFLLTCKYRLHSETSDVKAIFFRFISFLQSMLFQKKVKNNMNCNV